MPRRHLYVMDPLSSIQPFADTTFYFMLEGQQRGIMNYVCEIGDLVVDDGIGFCYASPTKVMVPAEIGDPFFTSSAKEPLPFDNCEVIWMRKDPPVDERFLVATMLLDHSNPKRTLMMNRPSSLRVANEKLWSLSLARHFAPHTVITSQSKVVMATAQQYGKVVLKPIFGRGGFGIMVFDKDDRNLSSAVELLTNEGRNPIVVQEYLPGARNGDKRILLLGGKPIGAVLRVPHTSDHRANLHVGGSAQKTEITPKEHEIAACLAPALVELGLHFVGIDVIDGKLTEVNVTSPTGAQEIDRLDGRTGKDCINAQVLDYMDRLRSTMVKE